MGLAPATAVTRQTSRPLLLLVVVLVIAAGCGSSEQTDVGHDAVYVALGDSYTAGPRIVPIADPKCGRSAKNYPALVARDLEVATFSDRSCSSATTLDLAQAQTRGFVHVNGPQLDAVDEDTTLITIGIGLNNLGISTGLLLVCTGPSAVSDRCRQYLSQPESTIDDQLKVAAGQVEKALEAIRAKAPNARIVLVGYPRVVPDEGDCPDRLPAPEAQVERIRAALAVANRLWAEAARKAGATYIDVYAASEGHDICADDPWVAGYRGVPGRGPQMHPYESYHEAVAKLVVKALTD